MRVLEPNTVTILPTNTCTAACRHCSMNSGPDRTDRLSGEQLHDIIEQLTTSCDIHVIVFSGGESTLLGDDLLAAIRQCKEADVVTRLVTNAFWATSPEVALEKLRELHDAGLDELNISTDDYHLPYISLQKVRNAYEAAITLNFHSVVICNAYGPESWLTPERLNKEFGGGSDLKMRFDAAGQSLCHERREGETLVMLSNGVAMQLGRGAEGLAESEVEQTDWDSLYAMADEIGGCPWALRSAAISPKGNLLACCGTEVDGNPILDYGNIAESSLEELLDLADNDLVTNMIAVFGPIKLKQLLEELAPGEIEFPRASYRGYCEVCEDLVGIAKNREALYKYQPAFVDAVTKVRDAYVERFSVDGKVRIPPAMNFVLQFNVVKPGDDLGTLEAETIPLGGMPRTEPAEPDAGEATKANATP